MFFSEEISLIIGLFGSAYAITSSIRNQLEKVEEKIFPSIEPQESS